MNFCLNNPYWIKKKIPCDKLQTIKHLSKCSPRIVNEEAFQKYANINGKL